MTTVLLISEVGPGDEGGRAEKLASRASWLESEGVETVFGTVSEPYTVTALPSLFGLLWLGRRSDVDLVTSVSNPFHLQVIGYLVSRLLGVPWLVEFRDPMVENPDRDPDALLTKLARPVERLAVTRAEQVIWGDGIQLEDDYFERTYGVESDRVRKLPFHGYDPAAFESDPAAFDDFTITYAGSFYDGWIEPYRFVEGLDRYVGDARGDDLRVQFYGDWSDDYQRAVDQAGLADVVETRDFVPHDELVPVLQGSDVGLYVGGTDPRNRLNVPSKIWDYVGARIPMLAIVDPDFRVAKLIERHGLGIVADPRDPSAIADAIEAIRTGDWEYDPGEEVFERFTRQSKMEAYATVINDVMERQ